MQQIDKYFDQHVHSTYSPDGRNSIEEYLSWMIDRNINSICFTNHVDFDFPEKGTHTIVDFKNEEKEIELLKKKYPTLNIFRGVEMAYTPEYLKETQEIINENKFNVVNFSLHLVDGIDFYKKEEYLNRGIDKTLEIYFEAEANMAEISFSDYDVFCHLDYGFKTAYLLDNTLDFTKYEKYIVRIMKAIIEKDKVLEINTKVQTFYPDSHVRYLLRLYKSLGGKHLSVSSDAHWKERLCDHFDYYANIIKEEGFSELSYFINRERFSFKI